MADQQFEFKFVQEGEALDYTPGADVAAGQVVFRGALTGVTKRPIVSGELGALAIVGVYDVVKAQVAFTDGAAVYWNATGDPYGGTAGGGAATTTPGTSNKFIGYAVGAKLSTDVTVRTLLQQAPAGGVQSHETAITDPGASGAIPVTGSGRVAIVTAGAETRTLAAPSFVGQELLMYMKTDGGDCVVTCATTFNETGNNTITFDNTGEAVRMIAVEEGATLRWRCTVADGAALTTV